MGVGVGWLMDIDLLMKFMYCDFELEVFMETRGL